MSNALVALQDEFDAYLATGGASAAFRSSDTGLRILEGKVLVDAVAADTTDALTADLVRLGASQFSAAGRIVSCYFPIAEIDQLSELHSLQQVKPAIPALRRAPPPGQPHRDW